MPTGGAVKLTIDADKIGYVRLPNGGILTTTAGVINTTYTGVAGRITYYVPKNSSVDVSSSGLSGEITYNGTQRISAISVRITKLTANLSTEIHSYSNSLLSVIEGEKADTVIASNCSLTAKSIGDILYAAYDKNRANVWYEFSGGTNAPYAAIDDYLIENYSLDEDTIVNSLVANGGVITLNP